MTNSTDIRLIVTSGLDAHTELVVPQGETVGGVLGRLPHGVQAVALRVDGVVREVGCTIDGNADIAYVMPDEPDGLALMRHSAAHVLAQALVRIYGDVQLGIGPAIEEGFYYDVLLAEPLSSDALASIEEEMQRIIAEDVPIRRRVVSREEIVAHYEARGDALKLELIAGIPEGVELTVYEQGEFFDLCRGQHVACTGRIGAIKLLHTAGAYWRGDSKRPMLQRIYGTAFATPQALADHVAWLEEAKQRDHRKLGRELKWFTFAGEVGQGLPIWLPRGATVRRTMERYIVDKEQSLGYEHVYTPVLGSVALYQQSGHWDHYADNMFPKMDMDNESLVLRPMNCPHHMMVYKSDLRSYRDLPVRIAELGTMHRYEYSGALTGLHRVRAMTLNDAHIFCRPDQIKDECARVISLIQEVYADFGIDAYRFRLSYRDPANTEKYYPDDAMWDTSQAMLREVVEQLGLEYEEAIGEAAFYGPKLDVQIMTALRKEETLSTVQLDFLLPQKFDLTYVDADGVKRRPVVIHRGVISTMERMTAFLLEHFAGALPTWLSPVHVRVIPVSDAFIDDAQRVVDVCTAQHVRAEADVRNEKLGYKIRHAQQERIPYQFVIGARERDNAAVSVRKRGQGEIGSMPMADAIARIADEIARKRDGSW
ncbi:MAG: threonine--tRNA ligase [Paenibacillaceae bacterium]|nr:threonine--tRNA ligase [Paenibacillaceae bacterium]